MALLCFCRLSWIFVLWMRIKADITVLFWCCLSLSRLVFCRSRSRRIPSPLRSTKNFPSGWGLVFCCDTSKLSLHEVKTTKRSKSAEKKKKKNVWQMRKMPAESRRNILWFSKTFSGNFLRAVYHRRSLNSKENKKPSFYHISWFKRLCWF